MGWGNKAIEIRAAETGHLDGVFMHKKAQKLKFLCERNDKVSLFTIILLLTLLKNQLQNTVNTFETVLKPNKTKIKQLRV